MIFDFFRLGLGAGYVAMLVFVFLLAILIALVLHEIAHGWVALKCGDPSAKLARRLSLNPARHLDPIGALCFVIAGLGWAKPVPVNPFNYRNFKRGNFLVSIAGIVVNLILGIIFSLCFFLMDTYVGWAAVSANVGLFAVYYFFYFGLVINIALMIFNLLPVFPLDGYNMLVSFTKPNNGYMNFMRRNSMFMLPIVLIVLLIPIIGGQSLLGYARNGIIDGFLWFWGLMF